MTEKREFSEGILLYAITDLRSLDPDPLPKMEGALSGGVDWIQLRSKVLSDAELYSVGLRIRELTRRHKKIFIVNDRLDIAIAVEADGVHLGQDDLPISVAKKLWRNPGKWIGRSTHSLEQALQAEREGADYIGVGPIFKTPTKPDYPPVGLDLIEQVKERVQIPFVAIGGIEEENLEAVLGRGARGVAVVRAVFGHENTEEQARRLKAILERYAVREVPSVQIGKQ